jgi:hypothetical protein
MAEKPMRVFPLSAGLLQHKQRMGAAIWEFLWLLDQCTSDEPQTDGTFLGIVKFGKPISARDVAADLAEHVETAKANLRSLADAAYVIRKPVVACGHVYTIVNSKKWFWKRANDHRSENPSKEKHFDHQSEKASMQDGKPFDDRSENASNNKESKSSKNLGRENHHACGALNDWLQIKSKLEKQLPEDQFKLWLRPMYLLKVMSGRVLLLSLPPNGRIVEAARFHQEELLKLVREAGYSSFCLTRYPDNYEREWLRKEHPDFYAQMYGQKAKLELAGFPDAIPPAETSNRLAQKQAAAMEVA